MYVFANPLKPDLDEGSPTTVDWDFAQKELAEQSGFATAQTGMTKGRIWLLKTLKFISMTW